MNAPQITIRMNASQNDVTVDGRTFDRSQMTRREKTFLRKVVTGALVKAGRIRASNTGLRKVMKPRTRRAR